jgi:hypothetical protein
MKVEQSVWTPGGWRDQPSLGDAQLVLVFGHRTALSDGGLAPALSKAWPSASVIGCSTAGQILGTEVLDEGAVATAVRFDHTRVASTTAPASATGSAESGKRLAAQLAGDHLVHVLVLSEGIDINGDALVRGMREGLPPHVSVSGGLSADGEAFRETRVLADGRAERNTAAAIGLYGSHLKVGCGSLGGWDSFGPERQVTRASGNVLYELDGQSALALYKR